MTGTTVLGVHSWISAKTQEEGNAFDRFTDGHAWLSVTRDGKTEYYGLWPDSHPDIARLRQDDPDKSDIRIGREANATATASRYYTLTPEQAAKLDAALKENVTWGVTMTCAGWASDTVTEITGKKLDATEFLSIETPRELVKTIQALEARQPTAPDQPLAPIRQAPGSSDSFGAADAAARAPVAFQELHKTSIAAVHRLEAELGRVYAAGSERLAWGATVLAASGGIDRIDHIVLSRENDKVGAGERFFVVKGGLDDPAHQRFHGRTQVALDTQVEQSLAQLHELERNRTTQSVAAQVDQQEQQEQQRSPRALG